LSWVELSLLAIQVNRVGLSWLAKQVSSPSKFLFCSVLFCSFFFFWFSRFVNDNYVIVDIFVIFSF